MSLGLAWIAALAWAAALVATPVALWLRLREGCRDAAVLVLSLFLAVQLVGLGVIEAGGIEALRENRPGEGAPGWLAAMLGAAGIAALAAAWRQEGRADRVAALAFGLFGVGHLLRELALAAARGAG